VADGQAAAWRRRPRSKGPTEDIFARADIITSNTRHASPGGSGVDLRAAANREPWDSGTPFLEPEPWGASPDFTTDPHVQGRAAERALHIRRRLLGEGGLAVPEPAGAADMLAARRVGREGAAAGAGRREASSWADGGRAVLGYDTNGDGRLDAFDTNQDGHRDVVAYGRGLAMPRRPRRLNTAHRPQCVVSRPQPGRRAHPGRQPRGAAAAA
jgi:hypothetical protein